MDFENELNKIKFTDGEADMEMIYEFIERLEALPNQRKAVPAILRFFEKNSDKDLGSPGPLVHFLENSDDYMDELKSSIDRKPTIHTVWMINRILNGVSDNKEYWFKNLQSVSNHPSADNESKESAKGFIEYQSEKI